MVSKEFERLRLKSCLSKMTPTYRKQAEIQINEKLITLLSLKKPQPIAIYFNQKSEVATDFIYRWLIKNHWTVYAPKVNGKKMAFYPIPKAKSKLVWMERLKVWEPPVFGKEMTDFAIMLVPIVGYNDSGYRLGHGQGYYDRWLTKYRPKLTIGLAYLEQKVNPDLIFSNDDVRLHQIITNKKGQTW